MASTCSLCSNIVNVVPARELSSSAAFGSGSSFSCSLPSVPKPASKFVSTKCSLSDEDQSAMTVGRRTLAGVVATGAALAVFTNMAIAAQGPGNEGARRVAEKADKLLKSADKLNIEDAPQRFGPGRAGGGDPTKISQQAGSGGVSSVKGSISDAASDVTNAAKNVQKKGGGFFGFGKKQTDTALSGAKEKADEVVSNVRQAVNRDGLGRFRGAAKEVGFENKKSEVTNSAKDAIGQAQSKANIGNSGGNVLSSLQEGIQGLKENIVQSGEDAKSAVQKTVQ